MANHRIFIAANFPLDVKEKLVFYQKKWENFPVRWTKQENLHLTLVFIGYAGKEELSRILDTVKNTVINHSPFDINFQRICLGPPNKPSRMFWVEGQKSRELAVLKADLESALSGLKQKNEVRAFKPHITLGRIRMLEWRHLQKKPSIDEKISLIAPVDSIEVMESQLKREGPEYTVLESIELKG